MADGKRSSVKRRLLVGISVSLMLLLLSQSSWAQGCIIPARGGPHMLGQHAMGTSDSDGPAPGESWLSPQRWQMSLGYRYFHSHRHYVGSDEQNNRKEQGTEVNNKVNILDVSATYSVSNRWTVSLDVPVLSM